MMSTQRAELVAQIPAAQLRRDDCPHLDKHGTGRQVITEERSLVVEPEWAPTVTPT
jgi:hypothetical protein